MKPDSEYSVKAANSTRPLSSDPTTLPSCPTPSAVGSAQRAHFFLLLFSALSPNLPSLPVAAICCLAQLLGRRSSSQPAISLSLSLLCAFTCPNSARFWIRRHQPRYDTTTTPLNRRLNFSRQLSTTTKTEKRKSITIEAVRRWPLVRCQK